MTLVPVLHGFGAGQMRHPLKEAAQFRELLAFRVGGPEQGGHLLAAALEVEHVVMQPAKGQVAECTELSLHSFSVGRESLPLAGPHGGALCATARELYRDDD